MGKLLKVCRLGLYLSDTRINKLGYDNYASIFISLNYLEGVPVKLKLDMTLDKPPPPPPPNY